VIKMRQELTISERRACRLVRLPRTTFRRVLEEQPHTVALRTGSSTLHTLDVASVIDASAGAGQIASRMLAFAQTTPRCARVRL